MGKITIEKFLKNQFNALRNYNLIFYLKDKIGGLTSLIIFSISILAILSFSRIILLLWIPTRIISNEELLNVITGGIRIDISSIAFLMGISLPLLFITVFINKSVKYLKPILFIYLTAILAVFIFLEVITPSFILEFDSRPNRLFIEYLSNFKEISFMILSAYKLELIISIFFLLISFRISFLLFRRSFGVKPSLEKKYLSVLYISLFLLCILGYRGTMNHRPINPAMVSFSNDHLLNSLSINSFYSVAFALRQIYLETGSSDYYGNLNQEIIFNIVKKATLDESVNYQNDKNPLNIYHKATYEGRPKNIVILLQESLGARYIRALGGLPLSPELDKLMSEGWNLTNLFATGTRSARGIEAVITGFTPTTSRAVIKLDKSQQNFFTIANLLKSHNYHTQFIYGGESHFDNMKNFFLQNGFEDIYDIKRFDKIEYKGSWGASDEDLYNQAHRQFELLNKNDKPFFSLVFTSSNHSPYEFPDNKINLYDTKKNTRNNAAKYADYALGKFFKKAKNSDYWDNTIFMVVADHDSRTSGETIVPIDNFHIPALILGKGITEKQDNRLLSQIDIPPTLLSMAGISDFHPMIGHDFTKFIPKKKQRALMQYHKNFAYLTLDDIVFLRPNEKPFVIRNNKNNLSEQYLVKRAKSHALLGSFLYDNSLYH